MIVSSDFYRLRPCRFLDAHMYAVKPGCICKLQAKVGSFQYSLLGNIQDLRDKRLPGCLVPLADAAVQYETE